MHHMSSGRDIAVARHSEVSSCVGPDTILAWPTFNDDLAPGMFNAAVFAPEHSCIHDGADYNTSTAWQRGAFFTDAGLVALLVKRFLHHVHIKNPMMNAHKVAELVTELAGKEPGWDEGSCLLVRGPRRHSLCRQL